MDNNQDKIMEAQLKKAIPRAFKQLLKDIESEPTTLIIESDNSQGDASGDTENEIRAWLFRRR